MQTLWSLPGQETLDFSLWWSPTRLELNPALFRVHLADGASWLADRVTVFVQPRPTLPMGKQWSMWAVGRDSRPQGRFSRWRHHASPVCCLTEMLGVPLPVASACWQLCTESWKEQKSLQLPVSPAPLCLWAFNSNITCGQRHRARTLERCQKIILQLMLTLCLDLTPWTWMWSSEFFNESIKRVFLSPA